MKLKKIKLAFIIVLAVLVVLSGVCAAMYASFSGRLESQKAAQRWGAEGETGFAQISCYLTDTETLGLEDIYTFKQTLDEKLTEASLTAPENGSLYTDAWSCSAKMKAAGDHGSGDAYVTAVGGDFFTFHPLRLVSGSYLTGDELMKDLVVLDRELAWMLFGSSDLTGLTVYINEQPFVVAGVVERETDKASRAAYSFGPGLFMSYESFSQLSEQKISCYEIVIAQPVDGFAEELIKSNFKLGGGEMVNNTLRSSIKNTFENVKNFGTRSMHLTSVIYPYWENAARYMDDWCALMFAMAVLFIILPVLFIFITLMVFLVRGKDYLEEKVPVWTADAIDHGRERRARRLWEKQHGAHEKKKESKKEKETVNN